jgi:CHASE2 domain-containing sensor protein
METFITPRELFLCATIGANMACGFLGFMLSGRIPVRAHVALGMLNVLIGAFALLVSLGPSFLANPLITPFVFLLLASLFKFMNQFEMEKRTRP